MATSIAAIPIDPTVYRRQARQIRAQFAGRPEAMHHALHGLARRSDRRPWQADHQMPANSVAVAIEKGFADFVAERVTVAPFTYSDRMAAMRSAEKIGMSRFRANLIVSLAIDSMSSSKPKSHRPGRQSDKPIAPLAPIILKLIAAEIFAAALLYLWLG